MKKRILLICMLLTLVLLSSCHESGVKSTDPAVEVEGVEVENIPLYADSVDELIKIINDVKQGKEIDTNNVSALDALIVPNFTIDGYYLMKIEVTKVSFFTIIHR